MERVTLFQLENSNIKIFIEIYFNENGQLRFDGQDISRSVEGIWGSSEYEYMYAIEPEEVNKFYEIFNVKDGDRSGLLQAIKKEFSVNKAFSLFGEFMLAQNIKHERFTWS
jgi:hypothetical protein